MSEQEEKYENGQVIYDSVDGVQSTRTLVDEELLDDITELIEMQSGAALQNIFTDLIEADIADILNHLPLDKSRYLFDLLSPEQASEILPELQDTLREELVEELSASQISTIVEELEIDDAVDIVSELDEDVAEKVLDKLHPSDSAELRKLLTYDEETAGGLMATDFPVVEMSGTVSDAIESVRMTAEETDNVYEVYVTDGEGKLRGTVDLKSLVLVLPDVPVTDIMDTDAISVRTDVDQEDVANVMRKYDLLTLPVVNPDNQPVGLITFDDIADVIHEEATEDIQMMSGISDDGDTHSSILSISRGRLPWLLVAFVGEILAAMVLDGFQASIEKVIASAFFIPIIMAMGGNSGIQASSIVVRGLATGELDFGNTFSRLGKEIGAALLNGAVCAGLLFAVVQFWIGDPVFGLTVALSLLVVMLNATIVGATIPVLLDKLGADPAIATGPFITTTNDAVGLLIYLVFLTSIYL